MKKTLPIIFLILFLQNSGISQSAKPEKSFTGHKEPILGIALSPDGKYILSGSDDNTEYSMDGAYILTGIEDGTAKLWNNQGRLIKTFGEELTVEYTTATFSRDGLYAIVSSKDFMINFWVLPKKI